MSKKPDKQGDGILLPILYAALAGSGLFCLIMAIGIAVTVINGPAQVAAAAPSAQPSYQGTLPTPPPSRESAPTSTPTPEESLEPSSEPTPEPTPEPAAPTAAPSQAPAPVQTQTPAPSRAPAATPSTAPVQNPAPVISIQPVQQNPTPAQSGNQGGGDISIINEITGNLSRAAYWVDGGYSYHFSSGCRSLARSTNIHQGTLQDALNAGKTDPCNNCANGT